MSDDIVFRHVPYTLLVEDPENSRTFFAGIKQLAESIKIAGGVVIPLLLVEQVDGKFLVKDGNRRLRAMQHLVKEGQWSGEEEVLARVVPASQAHLASGIANIGRENLQSWEIGDHYLRLYEGGMGQKEIGAAHGKSPQHVSLCIVIARDLHPKIIARCVALGADAPNAIQLGQVAKHRDPDTFGPDLEKQSEEFDRILGIRRKNKEKTVDRKFRRRDQKHSDVILERALKIPNLSVPKHARPYVEALWDFLLGKTEKPAFPGKAAT